MEGVEPSSAGCKPTVFPVRRHARQPTSGPAGSRTLNLDFKRVLLCQLSYKAMLAVCRAGVEPAQRLRAGYSHLGSPVPSRHVLSVPWMGFEPMLSTVRAWRPLRAGPPGHWSVAQGGVEPPASLLLEEGGLPVAYRANRPPRCQRTAGQSARRESNPPVRFGRPSPGPLGHGHAWVSGRRGSRTLKAHRSSGFGPDAIAHWLALPMQSGRLDLNQRSRASEARDHSRLVHVPKKDSPQRTRRT